MQGALRILGGPAVAVVAAVLVLLVAPAAKSETEDVTWSAPTPAGAARFSVPVGGRLAITLAATTKIPSAVVHISAAQAPARSIFTWTDGSSTKATFTWQPDRVGDFTLRFTASARLDNVASSATPRTYTVHVYPRRYVLTDRKVAHWTEVLRRAVVRAQPKPGARAVAKLDTQTSDDTQNIVLVLQGVDVGAGQTWYRVRLPILPNNSTGWVPARYLGTMHTVHTHLYVDRKRMRATLTRDGVTIFSSIVGVGKSASPTPRGNFYVRDMLTDFGDPAYGPIAFGTSARSPVLTDWPGGGFIGVHGTDQPGILPGRVSHGCVRMPNRSIVKLARLMPVGTPLTVT